MEGTPFGRYRLIEVLGRGGMGEVWRAFDTDTNRVVALKVLPANLASDPQFEQRFRREAFAAAGLAEPHVVPIHNFGEIEGRLYVDMRLIEGQDLTALLARGPLESARAVLIIDQIASALDEAHRIGLVHRDVKPSNILVGAKDFAYLIDFGIARAAGQTKLTGTGNVLGTWAYMAPERVTTGQTDPRADIYSLACVLHECLTGSQPFPGDSIEQQIGGHLGLPPPRPSQLRDGLPSELDTVIATGMAKNPDDRYTTASALANAARAAITEPISRSAMSPTEPAHRNEFRTRPAQLFSPREPTLNGPPPTLTRASAAQQGQPSVHALPTQRRSATDPNADIPVPNSATGTAYANPWKRHRVAIGAGITLLAVLAVVAAIVVPQLGDPLPGANETRTAGPDAGQFTGTFAADFGQLFDPYGKAVEDSPGYQTTWRLRSVCGANGCVATAATDERFPAKELVFDETGGKWLTVTTRQATCRDLLGEGFDVISLDPLRDGVLSGEWTFADSNGCFSKRTVTFTRTGDTDVNALADPADQPPRVVSPAEALRGRYDAEGTGSDGSTQKQSDFSVRTDCLRTGDRCMSYMGGNPNGKAAGLVFADGRWTYRTEYETTCGTGENSAEFPLPQPQQNPITLLSGHGHLEVEGNGCVSTDYELKYVRTGD